VMTIINTPQCSSDACMTPGQPTPQAEPSGSFPFEAFLAVHNVDQPLRSLDWQTPQCSGSTDARKTEILLLTLAVAAAQYNRCSPAVACLGPQHHARTHWYARLLGACSLRVAAVQLERIRGSLRTENGRRKSNGAAAAAQTPARPPATTTWATARGAGAAAAAILPAASNFSCRGGCRRSGNCAG
jgi:hypothetical protein